MTMRTKWFKTDAEVQDDVWDELQWDGRIQPTEVGVSVKEGVVTLSGHVDTYTKLWAAEELALRVRGVKAVANELEVRLPNMAERTDEELAQAVTWALTWAADVPTGHMHVVVSKGWVTLSGEVDLLVQRDAAFRAVRHLAGVRGVNNLLTVRQSTPAPADVQQRIERALARNAALDSKGIRVEIQEHTALLWGVVRSHSERRAAADSAVSAPGITAVENHLRIEE
jgi:osmotically-inducible protein OsmY